MVMWQFRLMGNHLYHILLLMMEKSEIMTAIRLLISESTTSLTHVPE